MTATHYLRVEGVNLGSFIFDSRDLSTVRGGSLMLLDAVDAAEEAAAANLGNGKLEVLSRGASSGLFAIETTDARAVASAVRDALAKQVPHATFVVDVAPVPLKASEFRGAVEALLAGDRWRQMQAASLAVPARNGGDVMAKPACAVDGVRPARQNHAAPNPADGYLSEASNERRKQGREAKQAFYSRVLERVADRTPQRAATLRKLKEDLPGFASDFSSIAKMPAGTPLDRKLGVFYADGNSFGSKQTSLCTDADKQRGFDAFLRSRRESFLADFLELACREREWQASNGAAKAIRFETLLWGGDEVMFVMPASLGWRFAQLFFAKLGGLNLKEAGAGLPDNTLTHAAALVFCQDHAPIDRIKRLAKDQMAELGKATDRDRDSLVVAALESFDHLGADYEAAMRRRYNDAVAVKDTILCGRNGQTLAQALSKIADAIEKLRESDSFPRSQLRDLVARMIQTPAQAPELAKFRKAQDGTWQPPHQLRNVRREEKRDLAKKLHEELLPCFASEATLWIQLEELWDYALL